MTAHLENDRVREYFEQPDLWSTSNPIAADILVAIKALLPDGVTSLLDVGCGDGVITNQIDGVTTVIGGDISLAAVSHVSVPRLVLSAAALPFPDSSFDVVLTTDMLEHLPADLLAPAMAELARVARVGVLVAVPFKEPQAYFMITCRSCGNRYHAHGHVRRYDVDALADWPALHMSTWMLAGPRWAYATDALAAEMRTLGHTSYDFPLAICDVCGALNGPSTAESPGVAERRYDALQYIRCEQGDDPWPERSELVALLTHAPAEPQCVSSGSAPAVAAERSFEVRLDPDRKRHQPTTHPGDWYWLPEPDGAVLILPTRPASISIAGESVQELAVFDAVDRSYTVLQDAGVASGGSTADVLALVRPDSYGYRFRIVADELDAVSLDVVESPAVRSRAELAELVFGSELAAHRLHMAAATIDSLAAERAQLAASHEQVWSRLQEVAAQKEAVNDLAEQLEARRSELEARLAERPPSRWKRR